MADVDIPPIYNRMRVIDYWTNPRGLTEEAALSQATAAFTMGWNARCNGQHKSQHPHFVDEELVSDWLAGWQAASERSTAAPASSRFE